MRSRKSLCDLFSLFVLELPPPTHTNLLSEYSRSSGDGFRTEEVAGKNRSGSTEQRATIADKLACYRITNDQECR
jgi:hypothetical protein